MLLLFAALLIWAQCFTSNTIFIMAEQLGVIQYRGKLGNTVGAKRSGTQRNNVMRVKVDPSNPRTRAQAAQRMKMNTALKMYRAIEPILSRSWQNKKYGTESRQFFMSQLMKSSFNGWLCPAAKGDYVAYPSQCAISVGSIAVDTRMDAFDREVDQSLVPTIDIPSWSFEAASTETVGAVSQNLIENVRGLESGDQITFVAAVQEDDSDPESAVLWFTDSLILDPDSTEAVEVNGENLFVTPANIIKYSTDTKLVVEGYRATQVIAAGFIVSREKDAQAGKAGLRTSSELAVSPAFIAGKNSYYEQYLRTYMNGEATGNSDWPVDNGAAGGGGGVSTEDIVTETSVTVDGTTYNNVAYVKHQGTKYVPYREVEQDVTTSYYTFRRENDTTFKQAGGTLIGVLADPADWLAAGYTLVTQNRFNQLVPGFTFVE